MIIDNTMNKQIYSIEWNYSTELTISLMQPLSIL